MLLACKPSHPRLAAPGKVRSTYGSSLLLLKLPAACTCRRMLPCALQQPPAQDVSPSEQLQERERTQADGMFRDNGLLMRSAKDTGGVGDRRPILALPVSPVHHAVSRIASMGIRGSAYASEALFGVLAAGRMLTRLSLCHFAPLVTISANHCFGCRQYGESRTVCPCSVCCSLHAHYENIPQVLQTA